MAQHAVEEYLKGKGCEVFPAAGGRELTLQCLFCGENHRKGKLYVNAESAAFQCKVCGHSGGWKTLLEHFGDEWDDEAPIARTSRRLQIHEEYLALAEQALWANERAVNFWRERGLSEQTIREFRLGYHPQGWSLVDSMPNAGKPGGYTRAEIRETGLLNERGDEFLEGRLIIPYLSSRSVAQLRGRQFDKKSEWGGKYVTPPGSEVMLFNSDALRGAEHVWLAEGEADAMIVHQHLKSAPDVKGRRFAVVAIPGVEALPGGRKDFPKYFESAKRVYVALDTDDTGRRAALEVRDVIGSHARILDYGKGFEDASDFLAPRTAENPDGGRDWQDLLRLVTETDMRNKRIFSVEEAAAQLYALEHGRPGIKLGWPTLDALISPGIYPGAVVVPLAKTGVGKTVLLTQIAWANRHRPTLFVSLELTAPEVWNRMRRTARFYEPAMTEEQHFGLLPQLRLMDENRMRSSDFEHLLDEFTEEVGQPPELVLIDYLGYYARGASGRDQYERMTNATMELKALAKEFGVAVITPGQVNRSAKSGEPIDLDSARDSGAVEETADFMFGVWRPWESEDIAAAGKPGAVQSELTVRILKSRRGNKGRQATLHMSHASLVVVDGSDRIATNRVQQENAWVNQGETYEQIYQRQRRRALAEAQGQLPPWER